jgi:CBS domain-containing protein
MTPDPAVVSMNDSAMEALGVMVDNHFRHLPVVDDGGAVVGVLDIAKCLNDAISKLEKADEQKKSAAEDAVKQMATLQGAGGQQAAMLTQLLAPLMAQAFGGKASPTLRSILAGKPATIVSPSTSLRDTAAVMSEAKKAALVVDKGQLVGIFGFKDMMSRAVAKELPLELTPVRDVMTPDPESVSPDMTVVEALQILHENKFLNLPVCEKDGTVCGLVGVMDLIYGCGGSDGWRTLFFSSIEGEDSFESRSVSSYESNDLNRDQHTPMNFMKQGKKSQVLVVKSPIPEISIDAVPNHVVFNHGDEESFGDSLLDRTLSYPVPSPERTSSVMGILSYKLTDSHGNKYLVRCDGNYKNLLKAIARKVDKIIDEKLIRLKFIDGEGDEIHISSDDCLSEAISVSSRNGDQGVKLLLSIAENDLDFRRKPNYYLMVGGGIAAASVIGISAMTLFRRSK